MSKKILVIAILVLWIIFIGGFIAYKEYTLKTGEKILLKTVPIDPRDLFRGDYIVLRYEISEFNLDNFENKNLNVNENDFLYVSLKKEGKYWTAKNVYKDRPEELAIKGRMKYKRGQTINIEYGIESFFVPEGEGKKLERYRNSRELDVEVSVDRFGNAVINNLYIDGKAWITP